MNYKWRHNKRYNSYSEHFKKIFGERVQKVSVDAGFTCPNRDGALAYQGCTYCNNNAFNPSYCTPEKSINLQIKEGIEFHKNRYRRANKYLVYFQPYSNTYAPVELLKELFNEALTFPGIIGLVIGTRPDCIDDEKLEYFKYLSKQHYIIIEYGIESCYNNTLKKINRRHTFEQSLEAIEKTARYGINVGAHMIFGLPGETKKDMINEVEILSSLPLNNIKFHQLQIIKNTVIASEYQESPEKFSLFTLNKYVDFIVEFIQKLNPDFIIERFSGEVPPRFLVAPDWGLIRNDRINILIEKKLEEFDTWQGKYYNL
ncbi:MAG: TIGR01212 family radical SAM protein [Bacteroidales bacterium]|nr:TIGR01212 family radical SAM protein [Bacteroidales bacterium]